MKISLSRLIIAIVAACSTIPFVCVEANAQSEIGQSWFDGGTYHSESEVQAMYSSNAQRPLGGLFAPGFTRTLTILGGVNFPSAGVSDDIFDSSDFGTPVFPSPLAGRTVDDSGYALSFAFGRRHSRKLRSEIEVAFRSNDINNDQGPSSPMLELHGFVDMGSDESVEDGRVNATSLMKNFIIDFSNDSRFTPYVGAGLGLSYVDVEFGESSSATGDATFQDGQALFTYQAIGGVATQLNSVADFIVEYRFLGTSEVDFDGLGRELAYNASTLFMGVKLEY